MRIDLLGPLPPPYGGVSVHLERLAARLRAAGHAVHAIAPQGPNEKLWTAYWRIARKSRGDVLHCHVAGWAHLLAIGALAALGRRVVLTIHGQSLEDSFDKGGAGTRWALRFGLQRLAGVIAVNERIRRCVVERGGVAPERVHAIPAFLPPDRATLLAEKPDAAVEAFLAAHEPVIAANAFSLEHYDGVALYGADLLAPLLLALRERHPRAGAVLFLATCEGDDVARLARLRDEARAAGVERDLLIVTGSRPFGPTLVRADVLVRPTATDGDAVSVREALWLGVPVVASDCVPRPQGTIVVATRDLAALARGIETALDGGAVARSESDPFREVVAVYERAAAR